MIDLSNEEWKEALRLVKAALDGGEEARAAAFDFMRTAESKRILSLAHPLNWLVSAIAAPISVLNPAIGVGVFTGIVEATMRKPAVKDFENLSDDISKFKGWFKNRVLHAFLIFFTSSLGSILGTFVLFPIMLKVFS